VPWQLRSRLGSRRPRLHSLPASAYQPNHSVQGNPASTWAPSLYPTPMDNLNGNHDRILNLEPWRTAAKRQPHDRLSAPSVAGVAGLSPSRNTALQASAHQRHTGELLRIPIRRRRLPLIVDAFHWPPRGLGTPSRLSRAAICRGVCCKHGKLFRERRSPARFGFDDLVKRVGVWAAEKRRCVGIRHNDAAATDRGNSNRS
jgi:hypothetical protein